MRDYQLKILTPEKRIYDGQVISITVTGLDGRLTVLAGHAPMLAMLSEGSIVIRTAQETIKGVTGRGLLRVDRDETAVMVHAFRWDGEEMETLAEADASVNNMKFF